MTDLDPEGVRHEAARPFRCDAYDLQVSGSTCAARFVRATKAEEKGDDAPPGLFWCAYCPAGRDRARVLRPDNETPDEKEVLFLMPPSAKVPTSPGKVPTSKPTRAPALPAPRSAIPRCDLCGGVLGVPEHTAAACARVQAAIRGDVAGMTAPKVEPALDDLLSKSFEIDTLAPGSAEKIAAFIEANKATTTTTTNRIPILGPVLVPEVVEPAAPGSVFTVEDVERSASSFLSKTTPRAFPEGRKLRGEGEPCARCGRPRGALSAHVAASVLAPFCSTCRGNAKIKVENAIAKDERTRLGRTLTTREEEALREPTDEEILAKLREPYQGPGSASTSKAPALSGPRREKPPARQDDPPARRRPAAMPSGPMPGTGRAAPLPEGPAPGAPAPGAPRVSPGDRVETDLGSGKVLAAPQIGGIDHVFLEVDDMPRAPGAPEPVDDETLAALGEGRLSPAEAEAVRARMTGPDHAAVRDLFPAADVAPPLIRVRTPEEREAYAREREAEALARRCPGSGRTLESLPGETRPRVACPDCGAIFGRVQSRSGIHRHDAPRAARTTTPPAPSVTPAFAPEPDGGNNGRTEPARLPRLPGETEASRARAEETLVEVERRLAAAPKAAELLRLALSGRLVGPGGEKLSPEAIALLEEIAGGPRAVEAAVPIARTRKAGDESAPRAEKFLGEEKLSDAFEDDRQDARSDVDARSATEQDDPARSSRP